MKKIFKKTKLSYAVKVKNNNLSLKIMKISYFTLKFVKNKNKLKNHHLITKENKYLLFCGKNRKEQVEILCVPCHAKITVWYSKR